jgi:hypothetical protein
MSENIKFEKTVYDKNQYKKLVNTDFNQLDPTPPVQEQLENEPTVNDFFKMYNDMFYQIPKKGEDNSHEFLVIQSSEYINFQSNLDEITALQDEISQLRGQLLEEQKRVIELQTGESIDIENVTAGNTTAGNTTTSTY